MNILSGNYVSNYQLNQSNSVKFGYLYTTSARAQNTANEVTKLLLENGYDDFVLNSEYEHIVCSRNKKCRAKVTYISDTELPENNGEWNKKLSYKAKDSQKSITTFYKENFVDWLKNVRLESLEDRFDEEYSLRNEDDERERERERERKNYEDDYHIDKKL